uniref:tetratricopeptide repeat protein 14-like n=1 Tax=Ciona intestinalis TaxID=7719 RepID=UPI000180AF32|nr:tetratricopeptide repeat protein 14-like [Ciona intestinalis]|eukprot:XP_002129531.1 tetratricopeptide repeat protein 14-like [Ciona intestinalis]
MDDVKQLVSDLSKQLSDLRESKGCTLRSWSSKVNTGDIYAVLPPMETFMGIKEKYIQHNVINKMELGDVIIGKVFNKSEKGIYLKVLCFDAGKSQALETLGLTAFCPLSEMGRKSKHEDLLSRYHVGCFVRGEIIECSDDIIVTLMSNKHVYGVVEEDGLPRPYTHSSHGCYADMLKQETGFQNPQCLSHLKESLIQKPMFSFVSDICELSFPIDEFAEHLRKQQSSKVAAMSVTRGVELCKQGRDIEALQDLNYALELDGSNVDALVARGAIYANKLSFTKAIADFELALKYDGKNKNAQSYLVEVLLTKAKSVETSGEDEVLLREAGRLYRRVLEVQPGCVEATTGLGGLVKVAKPAMDKVGVEDDKRATINKVKQLLEKDFGCDDKSRHSRRKSSVSEESFSTSPRKRRSHDGKSHDRKSHDHKSNDRPKKRKSWSETKKQLKQDETKPNKLNKTNKTITNVNKETFSDILKQISKFESKH